MINVNGNMAVAVAEWAGSSQPLNKIERLEEYNDAQADDAVFSDHTARRGLRP